MGTMMYQITSLTIVYSIAYSGADHRKHQSSASLAFVQGIHRWPVNSLHKGPVMRKMFPFDDIIMSCEYHRRNQLTQTLHLHFRFLMISFIEFRASFMFEIIFRENTITLLNQNQNMGLLWLNKKTCCLIYRWSLISIRGAEFTDTFLMAFPCYESISDSIMKLLQSMLTQIYVTTCCY